MQATLLIAVLALGAPAPKDKPNPSADLYGIWELERSESGGEAKLRPRKGPLRYEYKKDGTWAPLEGGKQIVEPRPFKIDTKTNPATIDTTVSVQSGEVTLGIYKIEGDTMTLCKSLPGKDRPTEFAAPPGSSNYLMVFKRVKNKD